MVPKKDLDEMLGFYSAALDEVYMLRLLLASESRTLEAHLEYKTFPKTRRGFAAESVERMRTAVLRGAHAAISRSFSSMRRRASMIGMPETLTRTGWEAEVTARRA